MPEPRSYRTRKCQHCGGTGEIEIGGPRDFKATDKMNPEALAAIAAQAVRSPVPEKPLPSPPPIPLRTRLPSGRFPTLEPPTMPDENWVLRHLARASARQWRTVQLVLFALLAVLVFVLHRMR